MSSTTGVKLDEEIKERLKSLGKTKQRSPHWLMKEAIREYLEKEEIIAARNLEADEAWEEYRRNKKGVPHEKMRAWFDSIESGKDNKCPPSEQL